MVSLRKLGLKERPSLALSAIVTYINVIPGYMPVAVPTGSKAIKTCCRGSL